MLGSGFTHNTEKDKLQNKAYMRYSGATASLPTNESLLSFLLASFFVLKCALHFDKITDGSHNFYW